MVWAAAFLAAAPSCTHPRRIIIYPIKGCDYWADGYGVSSRVIYRPGPPPVFLNPYIKRCYPDVR